MDNGKKKKLVINIFIFLAIMIVTMWFVFRDEGVEAVLTAMKQMSFGHLLLAVVIALFFV